MNNKSKIISVLLLTGMIATGCSGNNTSSSVTPSSGGASQTSSIISSSVPGATHKNINVHLSTDYKKEMEFYFFNNNNDIPYIEIEDSVNNLMNSDEYEISLQNNVYTVVNKFNNSTMTINTEGLVTFDNFSQFHSARSDEEGCYIDEFSSATLKCQKVKNQSSYTGSSKYTVDLSKFGFKPIAIGGKYYLPLNVMQVLISPDLGTLYYANDGEIYFLNTNKEMTSIVTSKAKTTYSDAKAFYEYNFNQFSLAAEMYYGLKGFSRTLRSSKQVLKYMPNGVISAFAPYKDKIINSKSISEFDTNLNEMICATMTDGGHSCNINKSLGNTSKEYLTDSQEDVYLRQLEENGKAQRKLRTSDGYDYYTYCFDTDEDEKYDIGYITFNGFSTKDKEDGSLLAIQNILRGKDGANIALNKNAPGYDSNEYDIKDVVIDLSLNTGGSVQAEGYLLSWICGGVAQQTLKGTNGGAYSKFTYNYDVDGDGQFNQQDYLPDDVNVYIIISPVTYSAANSLAFDAYLYNNSLTRKVKFIGQQSGGGAASVYENCFLPSGFCYQFAGNDVSIYPNNQTVCCEDGVNPTEGFAISEFNNIFKRTGEGGLNQLITSKRGK